MNVRICKKCGKQNSMDDWSCVQCGETLSVDTVKEIDNTNSAKEKSKKLPKTIICPSCGNVNLFAAKECIKCGLDLDSIREALVKAGKIKPSDEPAFPDEPKDPGNTQKNAKLRYKSPQGDIYVTDKAVFVKGKTWAVNNISSVAIYPMRYYRRSCIWRGLFWLGLLFLVIALWVFIPTTWTESPVPSVEYQSILFYVVIGIGLIVLTSRKQYIIGINAGGKMEEALITGNINLAEDITNSIEEAMENQ